MNPAFPAVVNIIPTCCRVTPKKRKVPARNEEWSKIFLLELSFGPWFFFLLFRQAISGSRVRLAMKKRTALNVKGPTYSIPDRWATNPNPHTAAVTKRKMSARKMLLFIGILSARRQRMSAMI